MTTLKKNLQWHNKKDVVQVLEAMPKMTQFFSSEKIDMLKLGKWQITVCTSQPMKNSTHFLKVKEICARKLERICWVDHQLGSRGKLLWTKNLSGIHQISAYHCN